MTRKISELSVSMLRDRFMKYLNQQQAAFRDDDIPLASRSFLKISQYADLLDASSPGRDVLEALLKSPKPAARLWAARYVRRWNPESAIPVLGRLTIEDYRPEISINEQIELRVSAEHSLYHFFGITSFDHNDLIEPMKAYGVDLPYWDHSAWQ